MASPKNREKRGHPDVDSNYNGNAYRKPRRMKPKNITPEATDSFLQGHDKRKKGKK